MALTASKSPQGLEFVRSVAPGEILMIPGDPGVTFARGDRVAMSNGVAILATGSLADTIGRCAKSTVCPAASQAFPYPGKLSDLNGAAAKTLIPVEIDVPAGVKVWKGTFTNHVDEGTITSYTAGTRTFVMGTGCAGNDYPNGALLYIYEGTGAGQVNVVEDYVHVGTSLVVHRDFETTPDSTSKIIIVSGEAVASKGIGFFGRMDLDDEDALEADDGADDGNFVVLLDFHEAAEYLKNLTLPVILATTIFTSP